MIIRDFIIYTRGLLSNQPWHYVIIPPTQNIYPFKRYNFEKRHLKPGDYKTLSKNSKIVTQLTFTENDAFMLEYLSNICYHFYTNNKTRIVTIHTSWPKVEDVKKFLDNVTKSCPGLFVKIFLSFDDVLMDKIDRKLFDEKIELIKKLKPLVKNNSLQAYCHLHNKNHSLIQGLAKETYKETNLKFMVFFNRRAMDEQGLRNLASKYMKTYKNLLKQNRKAKIKARERKYSLSGLRRALGIFHNETLYRICACKESPPLCVAGKKSITIGPRGEVYPCLFKGSIGNIKKDTIEEIIKPYSKKNNKNCFCGWNSLLLISTLYAPAKYPGILKKYIEFRTKV